MGWQCKICKSVSTTKGSLLKHYRLQHSTFGRGALQPCPHKNCPCTFKTQSGLRTHLSRYHSTGESSSSSVAAFKCSICKACCSTEKDFFHHIGNHLKSHETVFCVFNGCDFKTNIYNTFLKHKSRKHNQCTRKDFKNVVLLNCQTECVNLDVLAEREQVDIAVDCESKVSSHTVLEKIGLLLLQLGSVYNVSVKCIDQLVEELHFISSSVSLDSVKNLIKSAFSSNKFSVDQAFLNDLAEQLCNSHPISIALGASSPLTSAFKRRRFFKDHFQYVSAVEYNLDLSHNKTFQYVPVLETLKSILNHKSIADTVLSRYSTITGSFQSVFDGTAYKQNNFFLGTDLKLSIILYVDDFEVCNPLGTSRKKHKITAVYWALANLPSQIGSVTTSIHLGLLCKAVDLKQFGYKTVLEPLLRDIAILEQEGVFISSLGKQIRGTVLCVIADNLGSHSISGLVESFSGSYCCRFCLGHSSEYQTQEVRSGVFVPRTKEDYASHVETVKENPHLTQVFGVKQLCPLTDKLNHFHFVSGYPPDVLHDLFEGVVPRELALCFHVFIKRKYFSLSELNNLILQFPFKGSDKVNSPHAIPQNYINRKTIGGNAHENWALISFLPLIVGCQIPPEDSTWNLLLTLKDIVELAVSPFHTAESIAYLDFKISEHRERFFDVFPEETLTPKHHFLEHYPALIEKHGPLVGVWTMRFEAKHRFFKRVVRQTSNFKNVLLTLSVRHQMMMAYHNHTNVGQPNFCVTRVSVMPVELLHSGIQKVLREKSPLLSCAQLANTVTCHGTRYTVGMILCCGSTGGLPDFWGIIQMIILDEKVHFIVKNQVAWYMEHLRSFQLEDGGKVALYEQHQLTDFYPLVAYKVGGRRLVTLKRFICCTI